MKNRLFILFSLIVISCNNSNNSSTPDSTVTKQTYKSYNSISDTVISKAEMQNFMSSTESTDTLIIPKEKIQQLIETVQKSNLPKNDSKYIELSLKNSIRINQIAGEVDFANQQTIKKLKKNATFLNVADSLANAKGISIDDAINNFSFEIKNIIDPVVAKQDIDLFNASSDHIRHELDAGPSTESKFLKSFLFDKDNTALSHLFLLRLAGKINGFRIYIAKGKATPESKNNEYKLVIVGTQNGNDIDFRNQILLQSVSSFQDYGKPCKPNCGGEML